MDSVDTQDMLGEVERSPAHWREALDIARAADKPTASDDLTNVVVLGLGGSGIAGDVAVALAAESAPVTVVKGYELPSFVGPSSFVIAVSYSGNTEETLTTAEAARAAGATMYVVTSGGKLADWASEHGIPACTGLPGGRQPRASLPFLAVPTLVALERAGFVTGLEAALDGVGDYLDAVQGTWSHKPADVAAELANTVTVFHGGTAITTVVATRARCQVNENAKLPSWSATMPELNHNEIVGWTGAQPTDRHALIRLRDQGEHPQTSKRYEVTLRETGDVFATVIDHAVAGPTPVAALAAGVLWVDSLSVHMALARNVDPTPVDVITRLKEAIA